MLFTDNATRAHTTRTGTVHKRAFRTVAVLGVTALASVGLVSGAHAVPDDDITDPVLRACVEDALGIDPGDEITVAGVEALTSFTCNGSSGNLIESLAGIEHFTGLTYLSLQNNLLENIEELGDLNAPGLVDLRLNGNRISDLSPIEHMTSLTTLSAFNNYSIADLQPLAGLTELTILSLYGNNIEDVDVLQNMPSLEQLRIGRNNLGQDSLDFIAGLSSLQLLSVNGLGLTDVAPLAALTNLTDLVISDNHITDLSALGPLNLTSLYAVNQSLDLGDLQVGSPHSNPVWDANGWAVPLDNFYIASANSLAPDAEGPGTAAWDDGDDFTGTLSFNGTLPAAYVDFADASLLACVNENLGQAPDAQVTAAQAAGIVSLDCSDRGIADLSGLENLSSLSSFTAPDNEIVDVSPLGALGSMASGFDLSGNNIEDVAALAGMNIGEYVDLSDNHITDASPLGSLGEFVWIDASDQTVDLGEIEIDVSQDNPVVDFAGDALALSALYDGANNTFAPIALGAGQTTWSDGELPDYQFFSGTIAFTAVAAEEDEVPPTDPVPTDPAPEDPADEVPPADEPVQELAATGAWDAVAPLGVAALLVMLGLGLAWQGKRRGTQVSLIT